MPTYLPWWKFYFKRYHDGRHCFAPSPLTWFKLKLDQQIFYCKHKLWKLKFAS